MSNRAEEITTEVRKLVAMYRTAETQLSQSIPRKEHEQAVAKLQERIALLETELAKTKLEFEKSVSVGTRLENMNNQIVSQSECVTNQSKQIEQLAVKVSLDVVPTKVYESSLARISELEQRVRSMVEREHYDALDKRYSELEARVTSVMVPREEYKVLEARLADSVPKAQFEQLQKAMENSTVSLEKFQIAEKRLNELESILAESVPRSDLEGLVDSLGKIAREAVVVASTTSTTPASISSSAPGEEKQSMQEPPVIIQQQATPA